MSIAPVLEAIAITAAANIRWSITRRTELIEKWNSAGILWINNAWAFSANSTTITETFTVGNPENALYTLTIPRELYDDLEHSRPVMYWR